MFVSYAQAGEDVVLWRALGALETGTYVDVGAADPVYDSVTRAFYERGWRGVNVEPQPDFAKSLRELRPFDQTFQVAAGREDGSTTLHSVPDTGLSTVHDDHLPAIEAHFPIVDIEVEVRTLDGILTDAGLRGKPIHFMKIDVEGAEADALDGLTLDDWRPWVLVVEAVAPLSTASTHEAWEASVLEHGYERCLFDGLNRYYVSPDHPQLVEVVSRPAGPDDQFHVAFDVERAADVVRDQVRRLDIENARLTAEVGRWRGRSVDLVAEIEERRRDAARPNADAATIAELRGRLRSVTHERDGIKRQRDRMARSVSWRVTEPLRAVRSTQIRTADWLRRRASAADTPNRTPQPAHVDSATRAADEATVAATPASSAGEPHDAAAAVALRERLRAVTSIIAPELVAPDMATSSSVAFEVFERAVTDSSLEPTKLAWLAMVAATGSYPSSEDHEEAARILRRSGATGLATHAFIRFVEAVGRSEALPLVEVVQDRVLIDATHTVGLDLHTGIQRVTRECVSRWLSRPDAVLAHWNDGARGLTALADGEVDRMRDWRSTVVLTGRMPAKRRPVERCGRVVVPFGCTLLIPELVTGTERCSAYRAMASAGIISELSMIGYDLIPITAAEVVTDNVARNFTDVISLLKLASSLSAISITSGRDFGTLAGLFTSQGLPGPRVTARPLPSEVPVLPAGTADSTRERLDLGSLPVVLVVGSHEPRKNHAMILEAAERLWIDGLGFTVVLAGGATWKGTSFEVLVADLQANGRPVSVLSRVSEEDLWSLFALARFTMYPSLIEGYGLPIAESLASGTPVITSNYGSMAEIAEGGGALTVDPRSVDALCDAMRTLLTDDEELQRLEREAKARTWPTWDEYADGLWDDLVRVEHHPPT